MLPISIGVSLAIISVIGLIINGYIVFVVIMTKQISANNVLLFHLGLVDSLLCLLFLIFSLPSIAKPGSWLATSEASCGLHGFLLTLLHPVALWTICGLNCDRFYAIAAPLHYGAIVNPKKVIIGLGCGWIVALLLCIPPFFSIAPYRFNPYLAGCVPSFEMSSSLWYAITFTVITFLLPSILIIGCNIKVLMIARYHRHRIASAIYEVTLSAQVTITHQRNPFFVPTVTAPSAGGPKFRSRSPISSVLQLVGSFILLYCPYYSVIIWQTITTALHEEFKVTNILIIISSALLTSSSLVNGLLYGLKSKIMRKTFQNYWRKQMSKNEMINEIQARTPSTCGSRRPSLTPLGFLGRPMLQRRLSETLLDGGLHHKPHMKRIASELSWRPISLTFFGLESPTMPRTRPTIPHTSSCNTLQVPRTENEIITPAEEELYLTMKNSFRSTVINNANPRANVGSTRPTISPPLNTHQKPCFNAANILLQKVLRIENNEPTNRRLQTSNHNHHNHHNVFESAGTPRRSPRILITRAFSEESDKSPSLPGSPAKGELHRQYSSSSTLLERKWKLIKYKNDEKGSDSETEITKQNANSTSNSTTMSDTSCRRYSSLEEYTNGFGNDSETEIAEEQLLLSWPTTRKKFPLNKQQKTLNGNGRILKRNILYSDRSEEPEIIL